MPMPKTISIQDQPILDAQAWVPEDPVLSIAMRLTHEAVLEDDRLPMSLHTCSHDEVARCILAEMLGMITEESDIEEKLFGDLNGPFFSHATPHTDPSFARYFIMFVATGAASQLRWWEAGPMDNAQALAHSQKHAPQAQFELRPGQMLVFDAHQPHGAYLSPEDMATWKTIQSALLASKKPAVKETRDQRHQRQVKAYLTLCEEQGWPVDTVQKLYTFAITTESDEPVSRLQAEHRMAQHLKKHAPTIWARAVKEHQREAKATQKAAQRAVKEGSPGMDRITSAKEEQSRSAPRKPKR